MDILSSKSPHDNPTKRTCRKCGYSEECADKRWHCPKCWKPYTDVRRRRGLGYATAEQTRDYRLRSTYGITLEQYDLMFFEQGGMCAVCNRTETARDSYTGKIKKLSVDHNHETGDVRQLLCQTCNLLLGQIEKDRERIDRIVEYLKKHDT